MAVPKRAIDAYIEAEARLLGDDASIERRKAFAEGFLAGLQTLHEVIGVHAASALCDLQDVVTAARPGDPRPSKARRRVTR